PAQKHWTTAGSLPAPFPFRPTLSVHEPGWAGWRADRPSGRLHNFLPERGQLCLAWCKLLRKCRYLADRFAMRCSTPFPAGRQEMRKNRRKGQEPIAIHEVEKSSRPFFQQRSFQVDRDLLDLPRELERHVVGEVHRGAGVLAHVKPFIERDADGHRLVD